MVVFFLGLDRKETFDLRQYQSPQKSKFPRFREHKTYSVENILYVRASSSQTMTKYESRIAQNKGAPCNEADQPGEAILGTINYTCSDSGASNSSESQPLED